MKDKSQTKSGIIGNPFDLNLDGRTDAAETALMLMMFDEIQQEENHKKRARSFEEKVVDLDDMDIPGI